MKKNLVGVIFSIEPTEKLNPGDIARRSKAKG